MINTLALIIHIATVQVALVSLQVDLFVARSSKIYLRVTHDFDYDYPGV